MKAYLTPIEKQVRILQRLPTARNVAPGVWFANCVMVKVRMEELGPVDHWRTSIVVQGETFDYLGTIEQSLDFIHQFTDGRGKT